MKAFLPDFHFMTSLLVDFVGAGAFDELNAFFKRSRLTGSEEKMKVIRHDHKFVKLVDMLVAIFKKSIDEDFGVFGDLEIGAIFGALRGDEVRASRMSSVLEL